jgi:hypothetical protein
MPPKKRRAQEILQAPKPDPFFKSVDDVLGKIHTQVGKLIIHVNTPTAHIKDGYKVIISDEDRVLMRKDLRDMHEHINDLRTNIRANARKKIAYEYSMTRRIHPRMREYVNRTGDIKLYRDAYLPYKENVDVLYAKSRKSVKSFDKAYQNRYAKVLEFRKKFYSMSGKIIEEF